MSSRALPRPDLSESQLTRLFDSIRSNPDKKIERKTHSQLARLHSKAKKTGLAQKTDYRNLLKMEACRANSNLKLSSRREKTNENIEGALMQKKLFEYLKLDESDFKYNLANVKKTSGRR